MAFRSPNVAVQGEIERIEALSTDDIFVQLGTCGVELDEAIFHRLCVKDHSIMSVAKRWSVDLPASEPFLVAATAILWDRLCDDMFLWEQFAGLMSKGIEQIRQNLRRDAIDTWFEAWSVLLPFAKQQGIQDVSILDATAPPNTLPEECFAWVQDFEMELTNQVDDDPGIAAALLEYTSAFRETFPKSATPILLNMRSAEGIALFVLGDADAADTVYEELCERYPGDAWTYIDWGDQYSPAYHRHALLVDAGKAVSIYRRGLATATEDQGILKERIQEATE